MSKRQIVSDYLAGLGRKGGAARAKALTREQRQAIGRLGGLEKAKRRRLTLKKGAR